LLRQRGSIKNSGGIITNLNNKELTYGNSNFEQGGVIVASNGITNHRVISLEIKKIIRKFDLYPI
jgi:3'(2'), 5'-bisphosphate nucleotidase